MIRYVANRLLLSVLAHVVQLALGTSVHPFVFSGCVLVASLFVSGSRSDEAAD